MVTRMVAILIFPLALACPARTTRPEPPLDVRTPVGAVGGSERAAELADAGTLPPSPDAAAPVDPSACVPRTREEMCYFSRGSSCGEVPTGCPGVTVRCGCDYFLACVGGRCEPPHMTCDPVDPRDVCVGGACGRLSAGCPGASVDCPCPRGQTCRDGKCRK